MSLAVISWIGIQISFCQSICYCDCITRHPKANFHNEEV